ncbi:MAG: T9SS type A sorting domain-containing protein [Lewinellaceae bacterium]|nr:T9SS type A sorting domain-containing protein [Lewinellaceae bacterium]
MLPYRLFTPFAFLAILLAASSLSAQDTIRVQTFDWNSTGRSQIFQFPDNPGEQYRKIWMKYNMRCHDAAVGSGNVGCYEWDYSCNTFITDSSRVDSTKTLHPSHRFSNFSESVLLFTTQPVFYLVQYQQHNPALTVSNPVTGTLGAGTSDLALSTAQQPTAKAQFLYSAAEMQSAGLSAGALRALELVPTQSAQVGFLRIKIKATAKTTLDTGTPDLDGFTEVYFQNTNLQAGAAQRFNFYQPFSWDGTSNLLLEISYTREPGGQAPTLRASDVGAGNALLSSEAGHNLYFEGGGAIDIPASNFSTVNSEITIALWAKGLPHVLPVNSTLFEGVDANGNRQLNVHLPWGNSQVYWDCGATGGTYDRINKAANEADFEGQWNHWAFTKNAVTGEMKIYLNGALWHSGTGMFRPIDVQKFTLASASSGSPAYFGNIDEFTVWNKALDESTIQDWMHKTITPAHPNYSNLVAYYPMNAGTGDKLTNAVSNNADASIFFPLWKTVRGQEHFHNFTASNLRPNASFIQGNAVLSDDVIQVVDTLPATPTAVITYAVNGSEIIAVDTQLYNRAGYGYIFSETDMVLDSFWIDPEDALEITDLVYFPTQPAKYEILSLVTPYGNGLDLGIAGKTFTFDVTDYAPILKGQKRMSIELGGQNQEELDIEFIFIKGTPPREVQNIQHIWPFRRGNYADIQNDRHFEPRMVSLSPDGRHFKLRSAITGHGQNGEFEPRTHYLNLNGGNQDFTYPIWKECADNPIYPQGGTWIFDRAGWCPGAATDVHEFDITNLVTPGGQVEVDYGVNGAFMTEANYLVSNQLVTYGPYNFSRDAALERVARPNGEDVEFERINPACNSPMILVRNTGETTISSLEIDYFVHGNPAVKTYTWSGTIMPDALEEIPLPLTDLTFWNTNAPDNIFEAQIKKVNGAADENPANDVAKTSFTRPDVYTDDQDYLLSVKTNNNAGQNSYRVKSADGTVLLQRTNMVSNTIFEDDLDFPPGCYTMEFFDSGNDGLSFWFYPNNGTGYLRLSRRVSSVSIPVKIFNPDFGAGVQYDFIIAGIVSTEEEQAFRAVSTYPNPTSNALNVELRGFDGETVELELTDAQGRQLLQRPLERVPSENWQTALDLARFPSGMYFLRIKSPSKVWVQQIVRQ